MKIEIHDVERLLAETPADSPKGQALATVMIACTLERIAGVLEWMKAEHEREGSVDGELLETSPPAGDPGVPMPDPDPPFPILILGGVPQITDEGDSWNIRLRHPIDRVVANGTLYSSGPHRNSFELPKELKLVRAHWGDLTSVPLDVEQAAKDAKVWGLGGT